MQEGRLRHARLCPFRWLNIGILRCSPLSAQWWLKRQPMIILARFVHDHTSFQCTNNGGILHLCLNQRFDLIPYGIHCIIRRLRYRSLFLHGEFVC